jgi:hypothetical protein
MNGHLSNQLLVLLFGWGVFKKIIYRNCSGLEFNITRFWRWYTFSIFRKNSDLKFRSKIEILKSEFYDEKNQYENNQDLKNTKILLYG